MARRSQRRSDATGMNEMPSMAAGPLYDDRRPVVGRDLAVTEVYACSKPHRDPSHHIGPCDDYCRRGMASHYHRKRVRGPAY